MITFILQSAIRIPHLVLLLSLIRERFVDEHDRNIFFNRIDQSTRFANQAVSCLVHENIPFAFWTGQNLKEFLAERHLALPLYLISSGNLIIH